MKRLNLSLTNEDYGKLVGASAALEQDINQTAKDFICDGADVVLSGNIIEISDFETFEHLRHDAEMLSRPKECLDAR